MLSEAKVATHKSPVAIPGQLLSVAPLPNPPPLELHCPQPSLAVPFLARLGVETPPHRPLVGLLVPADLPSESLERLLDRLVLADDNLASHLGASCTAD